MKASVLNQALNKDSGASGGRDAGGSQRQGGAGAVVGTGGRAGKGTVDLTDEDATVVAAAAAAKAAKRQKGKQPVSAFDDSEGEQEAEVWEDVEDFEKYGGTRGSTKEVISHEHDVHSIDLTEDPEWDEDVEEEGEESEEEEEEEEEEDMLIPEADDVDPEVLASLPPSVQMEVMLKMRERRVMDNREQFQRLSGKMADFSELQMSTYLKSTELKQKMERVIKGSGGGRDKVGNERGDEQNGGKQLALLGDGDGCATGGSHGGGGSGSDGNFLRGQRIASLHDREYVYAKPLVSGARHTADAVNRHSSSLLTSKFRREAPPFGGGGGGGDGMFGSGGGYGRGVGRGRRGGRYGVLGAGSPLKAPQERFLLSTLNPVLPMPTVSRTIAEMPVLPMDQRAGNEGKSQLDLQITFDAHDAAKGGVDPMFDDDPLFPEENKNDGVEVLTSSTDLLNAAAVEEGVGDDEWEDVETDGKTAMSIEKVAEEEGNDEESFDKRSASVRRRDFWSLNHGFIKGRSLAQWDEDEEMAEEGAAERELTEEETKERDLMAVLNVVEGAMTASKTKNLIPERHATMDDSEDAQLQAAIALSLSTEVAEDTVSHPEAEAGPSGSRPRVKAFTNVRNEEANMQAAIADSLAIAPVVSPTAVSKGSQGGVSTVDEDVMVLDDDDDSDDEGGWMDVDAEDDTDKPTALLTASEGDMHATENTPSSKLEPEPGDHVKLEVNESAKGNAEVTTVEVSEVLVDEPAAAAELLDNEVGHATATDGAASADLAPEGDKDKDERAVLNAPFLEEEDSTRPQTKGDVSTPQTNSVHPSASPMHRRTVQWADDVGDYLATDLTDDVEDDTTSPPPSPPSPGALRATQREEEMRQKVAEAEVAAKAMASSSTPVSSPLSIPVDTNVPVTIALPNGAEPIQFRNLEHFEAAAARAIEDYPPYLPPEHALEHDIVVVVCRGHRFDVCAPVAKSLPAIAVAIRHTLEAQSSCYPPRQPTHGGGGSAPQEGPDDDAALFAATEAAEVEAANRRRLETLLDETDLERGTLQREARQATRGADAPTEDMYRQVQELLTLFGVPYIIAPQEAEAQCAWMNHAGLVDAVITDDSDAFLFGAVHVYRNVFESKKYVEVYAADRIAAELGLDRSRMAELALLLGSDYTEGVSGVGIVNALEVVTAFPGVDGLKEFREWVELSEFTGTVPNALLALPPAAGESSKGVKRKRSSFGNGEDHRKDEEEDVNGDKEKDSEAMDSLPDMAELKRLTVPALKSLLTARGLSTSGRKDDLVTRLEETRTMSTKDIESQLPPERSLVETRRERFKEQHRVVKKGWDLPSAFPSSAVLEAYSNPSVDQSRERLEWGRPDLDMLRVFCLENFNWQRIRTDELLLPVLKLWEKKDHQSRIDSFFTAAAGFNERFAKYRSERIREAVAGLTGKSIDPELIIEAAPKEPKGIALRAGNKGKAKAKGKGSSGSAGGESSGEALKRPPSAGADADGRKAAVTETAVVAVEEAIELN